MKNLITFIKAELVKAKGLPIKYSILIFPILTSIFVYIGMHQSMEEWNTTTPAFNIFEDIFNNGMNLHVNLMYPILLILTISQITYVDHKNGGWQLMETQPLKKSSIYFGKLITISLYIMLSLIISILLLCVNVWIVKLQMDNTLTQISFTFPFKIAVLTITKVFIGSIAVIALQYVLSIVIKSFIWPILIGVFGLLATMIATGLGKIYNWNPYYILTKSTKKSEVGDTFLFTDKIGILIAFSLLLLGFMWYSKKSWKQAYLSSGKRIGATVILILLSIIGVKYLQQPQSMKPYNKTIIVGTIKSDEPIKSIELVNPLTNDEIGTAVIKENTFTINFKDSIPLNNYKLKINKLIAKNLIFGNKDSLNVAIDFDKQMLSLDVKGTRLVENQMPPLNEANINPYFWYQMQELLGADKVNTEKAAQLVYNSWQKDLKEANTFKNIDNMEPRQDYKDLQKQLISVAYINIWNENIKTPMLNLGTPINKADVEKINQIEATIDNQNIALLNFESYSKYIIFKNSKPEDNLEDKKMQLENIAKIKKSDFKDILLYEAINSFLDDPAYNDSDYHHVISTYLPMITKESISQKLDLKYQQSKLLSKGSMAYDFTVTDVDNKLVRLSDYKGKYVMIDLWASWSGAHKGLAADFDKAAAKYKNDNIVFLSINLDSQPDVWKAYLKAKNNNKFVTNLYSGTQNPLIAAYGIQGGPRLILIDPQGKIFIKSFALPKDPAFDGLLKQILQ